MCILKHFRDLLARLLRSWGALGVTLGTPHLGMTLGTRYPGASSGALGGPGSIFGRFWDPLGMPLGFFWCLGPFFLIAFGVLLWSTLQDSILVKSVSE